MRSTKAPAFVLAGIALAFATPALAGSSGRGLNSAASGARFPAGNPKLDNVGFDQKLGDKVPLDVVLRDESGKEVRVGDLLNRKKPVVLALVYFRCPMLCNQVLNALTKTMRGLREWTAGREFDVLTVSFDPADTPDMASLKRKSYLKSYGRENVGDGWRFLTGDEAQVRRLADAVGFRYNYDAESKQFLHASGIVVLSPGGTVSRQLFGISYPVRDLRLSLTEASNGKVGSPLDKALLLFCYQYDSALGKYNFAIMGIIRVLGVLTVLVLATYMIVSARRDRRRPVVPPSMAMPAPGAGGV